MNTLVKKVVNCTPHKVMIMSDELQLIKEFPPCGIIPRVAQTTETIGNFEGVPLTQSVWGEVENLPEREEGTLLIVSALVA